MIQNLDDVGFMYVAEQTTPDDAKIQNMNVTDKGSVFFVEFDACLHSFEVINRNDRQYLQSNIEECLKMEKIQSQLACNGWYGEQDHPMLKKEGEKFTPQRVQSIYMPNRSHKIMTPTFKNNMLYGHIQTASGTEAGRGMANEIIQGLIPCFSCRAIAVLKIINGKPTVVCRKVVTYDWVLYPSHKEAMMNGKAHGNIKTISDMTALESVCDSQGKTYSRDIFIPVSEIFESVGINDVNTQVIMESFDLSKEDFVGINDTKSHFIFKDENNMIYAKMKPETVKQVNNFFESL